MADAVVACVTLAYVIDKYKLECDWKRRHHWISELEWDNRYKEGLIVEMAKIRD